MPMSRFLTIFIVCVILVPIFTARNERDPNANEAHKCRKCGRRIPQLEGSRSKSRINNGRPVVLPFKYPWVVKVSGDRQCSGSIIARKFILTAAICLIKKDAEKLEKCKRSKIPKDCFLSETAVKIGFPDQALNGFRKFVAPKELIPHPEYSTRSKLHDIALIKMDKLPCDFFSLPICLPWSNMYKTGEKMIIIGWHNVTSDGVPGRLKLREAEMRKVNKKKCEPLDEFLASNMSTVLCGGGVHKRQDPCKGENGAAIFQEFDNAYFMLGVTTLPPRHKCEHGKGITYTKVLSYKGWIKKYVKKIAIPFADHMLVNDGVNRFMAPGFPMKEKSLSSHGSEIW